MNKIPYREIKQKLESYGYHLLIAESEYRTVHDNMPMEKEGYIVYCSVSDILSKNKTKSNKQFFVHTNPFRETNMRKHLEDMQTGCKILSFQNIVKGNRKRTLIKFECVCGATFQKVWDSVKDNKRALMCPRCSKKLSGLNHRKDKQEALSLFAENGYNILSDTKNFLRNEIVEIENSEGYRGFISYNQLLRNSKISIFDIRINRKNYIYNANIWAKNNGINTVVLDFDDEKPYTRQGIRCQCGCGNEFVTSIASFQNGKTRCEKCAASISKYEVVIKNFLDVNDIDYIYQYRVNSCKDVLPLPFDFWIDGKLIEVDGQGHYYPCHFNQMSYDDAEKSYLAIVKHDKIKNDYCKQFSIPLLRIPYWEIADESYKDKIIQFIEA